MPLKDDMELTSTSTNYDSPAPRTTVIARPSTDFSKMSSAERVAYARQRLNSDGATRNAQRATRNSR